MEPHLRNVDTGVDPQRVYDDNLKRPVTAEEVVPVSSRDVHGHSQASDRAPAVDYRHQVVRPGVFDCPAQVKPPRLKHKAFWRYREGLGAVVPPHVERTVLDTGVNDQLVVQGQVVAVWVQFAAAGI